MSGPNCGGDFTSSISRCVHGVYEPSGSIYSVCTICQSLDPVACINREDVKSLLTLSNKRNRSRQTLKASPAHLEQIIARTDRKGDSSEEVEEASVEMGDTSDDLTEPNEDDPRELGERSLSDIFDERFED